MYRIIFLLVLSYNVFSQTDENKKWFSFGMRNTSSVFSNDGWGIGVGSQFRIQLSDRVNTDFMADYISINVKDIVRSEYIHVGWSVLFYPVKNLLYPKFFQPYILAGHCFDYNKKSSILNPKQSKDRWGSAVQVGVGNHFNITNRFDISLMAQSMIHLTSKIVFEKQNNNEIVFLKQPRSTLEGHLLLTVSINYKIFSYGK